MLLTDFDYHLPPELIAQQPLEQRDATRLLTLDRKAGAVGEVSFPEISGLLRPGDLLVVNNTRVIPARLLGRKETGGNAEVFLVRRQAGCGELWNCLIRSSKRPRPGTRILFTGGMTGQVVGPGEGETWQVDFVPADSFAEWLDEAGLVPLPPYIKRDVDRADRERYQTVFAREPGAVAAPTAGLHFTGELLNEIRSRGIAIAPLTLHVGLGTFLPVRVERVEEHRMHREFFSISAETASAIDATRKAGGRVIAVGTTVARALEFAAALDGTVAAGDGDADIFIYPGYQFRVVDALVTNFHLPQSTLLMLVSAFAGREPVLAAYAEAVRRRFRFFSYGDAMLIS